MDQDQLSFEKIKELLVASWALSSYLDLTLPTIEGIIPCAKAFLMKMITTIKTLN